MRYRALRFLAGLFRTVSYLLVFYAGLVIGNAGGDTGASPMLALVGASLCGAAATATRETAHL